MPPTGCSTRCPSSAPARCSAHVAAFVTQEAGIRVEPAQVAAVPLAALAQLQPARARWPGRLLRTSRDLCRTARRDAPGRGRSASFTHASTADFEWERVGVRHWDFDGVAARDDGAQRSPAVARLSGHPGRGRQRAAAPVHDGRRRTARVACGHRATRGAGDAAAARTGAAAGRDRTRVHACWSRRPGSARNCSARSRIGPWPTPSSVPRGTATRPRAVRGAGRPGPCRRRRPRGRDMRAS